MLHVLLATVNLIELVTVVALDDGSLLVLREVNFEELEHELTFIRLSIIVYYAKMHKYHETHFQHYKMINVPKFFVSIFPFS